MFILFSLLISRTLDNLLLLHHWGWLHVVMLKLVVVLGGMVLVAVLLHLGDVSPDVDAVVKVEGDWLSPGGPERSLLQESWTHSFTL